MTRKIGFTVIVPARNEEKYIEKSLASIRTQNYKNFEIIVVDNASTDRTASLAKKEKVVYRYEPKVGLPQARQCGFKHAQKEWLVYIDADSRIPKNYLSELAKAIAKDDSVIAISNPFDFYDSNYGVSNGFIHTFFKFYSFFEGIGWAKFLFGGNFAVKKEVIEKIGGFDTSIKFYGEDTNLTNRVKQFGKIVYLKKLTAKTSARRYKKLGFWKTIWEYLANFISYSLLNKPFFVLKKRIAFSTKQFVTGFLVVILAFFIYEVTSPKARLFGPVETQVSPQKNIDKVVALTFDDGPNGQYTEEVLTILKENHINGTFFLIGENVLAYPEVTKDIATQGNKIGNHSFNHSYFIPFDRKQNLSWEIEQTDKVIFDATGIEPTLFRPPHGWRTPKVLAIAKQNGLRVIEWNDMTTDYLPNARANKIAGNILKSVKPGSIIVFHDGLNLKHGANREQTVQALKIVISALKSQGYNFITL